MKAKSYEDKHRTSFRGLKMYETTVENVGPGTDRHTTTNDNTPLDSSRNGLEGEEMSQNEYNLARFCFFEDIREIEYFLVLEIISDSLRPLLSSRLAFLTNLGHDLVRKSEEENNRTFGDQATELERGFLATVQVKRISDIDQPLLRMRAVLMS